MASLWPTGVKLSLIFSSRDLVAIVDQFWHKLQLMSTQWDDGSPDKLQSQIDPPLTCDYLEIGNIEHGQSDENCNE